MSLCMQQVANGPSASANGPLSEFNAVVSRLHAGLWAQDPGAADSLSEALTLLKDGLDKAARERYALAQICDMFRVNIYFINCEFGSKGSLAVKKGLGRTDHYAGTNMPQPEEEELTKDCR